MDKVSPFLWFKENNALEAAQFYTSLFPNSEITDVHKSRVDTPSAKEGDVLLVSFTLDGRSYSALNGGCETPFNNSYSMSVMCEDQVEVDRLWAALTADGGQPIACGWLKDKYGLAWQIVPKRLMELITDPDTAKGKCAMQAMMHMVKLDIAKIEEAASVG
jgi:predicted 3-demethylubiquinone-9 3-methyltransferase (glyoxalase superfamily)